jgi:hypothetical protein
LGLGLPRRVSKFSDAARVACLNFGMPRPRCSYSVFRSTRALQPYKIPTKFLKNKGKYKISTKRLKNKTKYMVVIIIIIRGSPSVKCVERIIFFSNSYH